MKKYMVKREVLLNLFKSQLAVKFNRTEQEIMNGLMAYDFDGQVRLVYEDGSFIHFQSAFLFKTQEHVGVFTEHCGYYLFDIDEFDDYREDAPWCPVYPRDNEEDEI